MKKDILKEIRKINNTMVNMSRPALLLEQDFQKMLRFFADFTDETGRILIKNLPNSFSSKKLMKILKKEGVATSKKAWEDLLNKYLKGGLDAKASRKLMVILGESIPEMRPFLKTEVNAFVKTMATSAGKSTDDMLVAIMNNPKLSKKFNAEWMDAFGTNAPLKTLKEMIKDGGLQNKLVVLFQEVKGFFDKFKRTNSSDVMDQLDNAVVEGLSEMNLYGKSYMEIQELFNETFSKIWNMKNMNMNYNSIDDLVDALSTAISKGDPFDSKLIEDLHKLLKTQPGPKKAMMSYLRDNSLLKKQFRAGKLSDESIDELLGGNARKLDVDDLKASWSVRELPVLSPTWKGIKNLATNGTFWKWFAYSQIGSIIGSTIIQLARAIKYTDKAMAGTHQDFYAQIRGAKDIVLEEGGLRDEEAKMLAVRLDAMFNYLFDNEEEIKAWADKNAEHLASGGTNTEEELTDFDNLVTNSGSVYIGNLRYVLGTRDGSIVKFYDNPPEGEVETILAASQICYWYETDITGKKDSLWTTFKSMQAKLTIIPILQHILDDGEEQITAQLDLKPWGFSVDKTTDKIATVINSFYASWPTFPPHLPYDDGKGTKYEAYSLHKGRIPIDHLALLSERLGYTAGSIKGQQHWLDNLTANEFNEAYCYKKGEGCDDIYLSTKEEFEEAAERGELIEGMDEEAFKTATQQVINQILNQESNWIATFWGAYTQETENQ